MNHAAPTSEHPASAAPDERVGAGIDFTDPHSPLAPLYLRTGGVVACALVALMFVVVSSAPLWHSDVWGHLKFGEWMAAHGAIPAHEPFCPWSDKPAPFVQFYGLSQLAFCGAYHLGAALAGGNDLHQLEGGAAALRLGFSLIVLLRLVVLVLAFRRLTGSTPIAAGLLVLVFLLSLPSIGTIRPQMFGELFFACLLLALSRPLLSWRAVVLLPMLFVVWVNSHGSFLIGLVLLGVILFGRVLEVARTAGRLSPRAVWRDSQARRLGLTLFLSAAAACLNPSGPLIYLYTLQMAHHPAVAPISEWQPLGNHPVPLVAASPVIVALVFVGLFLWLSPRPLTPTQGLLIVLFGVGACCQQRIVLWLSMIIPWTAAPHVAAILEQRVAWNLRPSVPSFRKTLIGVACAFAALMWSPAMRWVLDGSPPPAAAALSNGTPWRLARQLRDPQNPDVAWLPELSEVLKEGYPDGRFTGAVFSSETQGDYLTWALAPEITITSYSHLHLFPRNYWDENLVIFAAQPGWWDMLMQRHANLVALEAEVYPELCQHLRDDPGWLVVRDETGDKSKINPNCRFFIAVRKKPA